MPAIPACPWHPSRRQQELRVVELSAASGEVLRQTSVVAPYRINPQQLVLLPEGVVALSDAGGQVCSMALTGKIAGSRGRGRVRG